MKVLIINPNSDEETDRCIREKTDAFVNDLFEVDVKHVNASPKLVGSYEDMAKALPEMLNMVVNGEEYDAFIVACHSDPNLDVLKEISDKPVVGIAEASMKIASLYCNGFAIISPGEKSIPKKWALAEKYHCAALYRGAQVSEGDDKESLLKAARRALEQSHVDGIILGCANYAHADRYIQNRLHIPVFDGIACALMLVPGLIRYHRYKK